jgi:hypothetical protein
VRAVALSGATTRTKTIRTTPITNELAATHGRIRNAAGCLGSRGESTSTFEEAAYTRSVGWVTYLVIVLPAVIGAAHLEPPAVQATRRGL